ncbi:MAG: MmgE/PrpD family protein [Noviherbaspirillum sp.]
MTAPITRELAGFVAGLRFKHIPAQALPAICMGFADCVGVMIAGRDEPPVRLLQSVLAPQGNEASLLFGRERAGAADAALINGTAAHALDYDDVALRGHPSTAIMPALLAEAEASGADGRRMATAYAAGYEVWADLVRREPDQHHTKGWHPTGIFGAIGAAAACASLRGLNAEATAYALALAASQSAGLMANFGTMSKPFHAGRAAQSGVISARLAAAGFTAAPDALEHPQGFLAAVSPAGNYDAVSPVEAGADWKLPRSRLSIKKYPMCFATHRALDGMLDLLNENKLAPSDVRKVSVSISRRNAAMLRNRQPQTGLEAKFSMQFAMASALIVNRASLAELNDAFVSRADVQELMRRVEVVPDDRCDPNPHASGNAIYDQVTVETINGVVLKGPEVNRVRGGPDLPMSRDELWGKFSACARAGALPVDGRALFDALMALPELADARRLIGLSQA